MFPIDTMSNEEDYFYTLSIWSGLLASADGAGAKYNWQQCVSTDRFNRKKFKNVYRIQELTCRIEECLFLFLRLFVYEIVGINDEHPFYNLESLMYCMQRLIRPDRQYKRSPRQHRWWMRQTLWSKKTTMDHFIDDVLLQACTSIACCEHEDKAKDLADRVRTAVKISAPQIIDMFVLLSICQNYVPNPSQFFSPVAPCETGIYACRILLGLVRQMVEDAQFVNADEWGI